MGSDVDALKLMGFKVFNSPTIEQGCTSLCFGWAILFLCRPAWDFIREWDKENSHLAPLVDESWSETPSMLMGQQVHWHQFRFACKS